MSMEQESVHDDVERRSPSKPPLIDKSAVGDDSAVVGATATGMADTVHGHASLLRLQRTAGNAAVAALLQREKVPIDEPEPKSPVLDLLEHSDGQPLPPDTRANIEERLGDDFSDVRVHTDANAADSAEAVSAKAYTVGNDVVFGRDAFAPDSASGAKTLVHELIHVQQQRRGPVAGTDTGTGVAISDPSDSFETEAETMALQTVSDREPPTASGTPSDQRAGSSTQSLQRFTLQRTASPVANPIVVQRDVVTDTTAKGGELGPTPAPAAGATLSDAERIELRRFTGDRIRTAFPLFTDACQDNRAAVKAAAKESSSILGLLLEIGVGFLLPGIAGGIAHLAEELPANASNLSYRVALAAMNEERTKAALEVGVKVGSELIKGAAEHLEGEDEIDAFLTGLKSNFVLALDKIDGNLPKLTDEQLGVVCAAYDPSVAGPEQFRASVHDLIGRYQREVQPIGKVEYGWMNREWGWTLYRIVFPNGGRKLAVVKWDSNGYSFDEFVAPEMRALALAKFAATGEGRARNGVPLEASNTEIEGVPLVYEPDPEELPASFAPVMGLPR